MQKNGRQSINSLTVTFGELVISTWKLCSATLITCSFAPFYSIEMGFSPEIIEFYAEHCYQSFNTLSWIIIHSNDKFGHHIWRHNSSHISSHNLSSYLPAKFRYIRCILHLCTHGLELLVLERTGGKALATDHRGGIKCCVKWQFSHAQ